MFVVNKKLTNLTTCLRTLTYTHFKMFAGVLISFNRCVGNSIYQDDCTEYWANGYKGDFYEAFFDEIPYTFQWRFAEERTDCTTDFKNFICNCSTNDVFDVTCFYSNYNYKNILTLKRELTAEDSASEVIIRDDIQNDPFTEYMVKYIKVSGEPCILYFTVC